MANCNFPPLSFQIPCRTQVAGQSPRTWIMAEIGVNHDGDPERAKDLVQAAARAGADAVKFQIFSADRLLSQDAELASYQQGQAASAHELLKGLELSPADFQPIRKLARQLGLAFVLTPFSPEDTTALAELEVDAVKIASPDAVNPLLLRAAVKLERPMIVSTGTCDLHELEPVVALLRAHAPGGALLHCVSAYPTPLEEAALGGIGALRDRFELPVGYSDHTRQTFTGAWAVAAGACVLEKHLTWDISAAGPDHAASLNPQELADYVALVRQVEGALGPRLKTVSPREADVRRVSRQSLCVRVDLPQGHRLREEDLTARRPGTGVPAAQIERVVGRTLRRELAAGALLQPDDLLEPLTD